MRTLPLLSQRVAQKANCVVFVKKNQFKLNELCYKVSLCENFQQHSCRRTIPLSNGVYKLAVCVLTLQPNISPQRDPTTSTKADLDVFACSASAIRDNEKCSIITYRKSTTSFRLVPESVTLNDPEWRIIFYNFKPWPRCPLSNSGASC